MAWISVHEQVLGGKLRTLAKRLDASQNEALGLLVRIWLWGINNADKEGRIVGANKRDVSEVVAVGISKKINPDDAVDALIETNWIDLEGGDLYLHDWDEWQEQWYKAMEAREKDAKRHRENRARARAEREKAKAEPMARKTVPEAKTETETPMEEDLPMPKLIIPHDEGQKRLEEETPKEEPKNTPKKTNKEEYPDGFNAFWDVYPRKVGKGDAYRKYKARLNNGWKPEELLLAAQNYASKMIREKTEKQYIKHPSTFLSETTPFVDYLPAREEEPVPVSSDTEEDDDNPFRDWREEQ